MNIAKTFLATLDLRRDSIINAHEIRALRLYFNKMERDCQWDDNEWDAFQDAGNWVVDDESKALGLKTLSRMLVRPNGLMRKTAMTREWSVERCNRMRHCLHALDHIRFTGFEPTGHHRTYFFPRYRVFSKDMETFGYVAVPWQSGSFIFDI